jgi:hypothetical protein
VKDRSECARWEKLVEIYMDVLEHPESPDQRDMARNMLLSMGKGFDRLEDILWEQTGGNRLTPVL